jgi:hypothetical protein
MNAALTTSLSIRAGRWSLARDRSVDGMRTMMRDSLPMTSDL